jgi:ABC-type transporter Mla subunit MlaD
MANMRPYDVAISNAIERGDARKLEAAIQQAKELHEQQGGDLSKAIKKGEAALKKLSKSSTSKGKK